LAQQYRYSGCTRDDFAAKNAAARAALEKFGELPQDVLEGMRRSKFAPPVVRRGLQQRGDSAAAAASPTDEGAAADSAEAKSTAAGEDEPA
ncbi:TPA: AcaB family transcriptional regulator, partial [Pseudomonas aeruginosa]